MSSSNSLTESIFGAFIAVIGLMVAFVALIVLSASLNGYVLSKLWAWFVVTTFHAPALSLPAAIGLGLVVSYLTYQHIDTAKNPESKWWTPLLVAVLRPLIALAFGAVVHSFL